MTVNTLVTCGDGNENIFGTYEMLCHLSVTVSRPWRQYNMRFIFKVCVYIYVCVCVYVDINKTPATSFYIYIKNLSLPS